MRFNYQLMDNFNLLLLFIAAVKWPAEDWKLIYAYESRWIIHICMLGTGAAAAAKQRRHLGQIREHPYQRAGALSWIRRAQSQYCTRLREKAWSANNGIHSPRANTWTLEQHPRSIGSPTRWPPSSFASPALFFVKFIHPVPSCF